MIHFALGLTVFIAAIQSFVQYKEASEKPTSYYNLNQCTDSTTQVPVAFIDDLDNSLDTLSLALGLSVTVFFLDILYVMAWVWFC